MAKAPKPANQGGVAPANVRPSRVSTSSGPQVGTKGTPTLGQGHATNPIIYVSGVGGTRKPNC